MVAGVAQMGTGERRRDAIRELKIIFIFPHKFLEV